MSTLRYQYVSCIRLLTVNSTYVIKSHSITNRPHIIFLLIYITYTNSIINTQDAITKLSSTSLDLINSYMN